MKYDHYQAPKFSLQEPFAPWSVCYPRYPPILYNSYCNTLLESTKDQDQEREENCRQWDNSRIIKTWYWYIVNMYIFIIIYCLQFSAKAWYFYKYNFEYLGRESLLKRKLWSLIIVVFHSLIFRLSPCFRVPGSKVYSDWSVKTERTLLASNQNQWDNQNIRSVIGKQ